ncbi:protein toll [Caerostris extrusa]|uniref:Protein toll n=1 Tax=Caerostris extrusa TaxID=172846 RepID=A0AAV4N9M4_CAEEX|nr:protein toll [Caerostris extrusa]
MHPFLEQTFVNWRFLLSQHAHTPQSVVSGCSIVPGRISACLCSSLFGSFVLQQARTVTYIVKIRRMILDFTFISNGQVANVEAPSLKYLNVSENKIEYLSDSHVKNYRDLEDFDLSKNRITTVQLGITNDVVNIRNLILSNNLVRKFDIQWRTLRVLENLYVDFNEITHLELPPCIPSVKQTVTFTFQHNKISTLKMNSLLEDEKRIITDRMMAGCLFNGLSKNFVDISHNPPEL